MERYQIHAFGWRKRRIVKAKNKTLTRRLAFPFFLKTIEKQGNFQKRRTVLLIFWNFNILEL